MFQRRITSRIFICRKVPRWSTSSWRMGIKIEWIEKFEFRASHVRRIVARLCFPGASSWPCFLSSSDTINPEYYSKQEFYFRIQSLMNLSAKPRYASRYVPPLIFTDIFDSKKFFLPFQSSIQFDYIFDNLKFILHRHRFDVKFIHYENVTKH